ncbi:hypothetical protein Rhe02_34570 [Rhizocola hellebori]|uniref:Ig-like domain-containing protein n=1 Tax=Rhizocola hellebori TaxID=1392758 RepID=A0A8J3Q995_9ACTN|nr:hypothetical protein [Rhizocola hellebori]GIH05390.1 hypothetical protein Rhe02_34570 [Rhizocola hellebori]
MRRRLTAMFLALVTVAASLLAGAAPASAADLSFTCGHEPGKITCSVNMPNGKTVTYMEWWLNGISWGHSGSNLAISFDCIPGKIETLRYVVVLAPPLLPPGDRREGTFTVQCAGEPIGNVNAMCSSGGNRLQCSVTYSGGPAASIRWIINGQPRYFFDNSWWLDISCPSPDVSISVTVSDLNRSHTVGGYCSCHGGPLD